MAVQALVPAETELSILIVDDDEAANRSLSLGLGAHGYHVATVADGASVLQRLAQEPFDLLLIDTMMPGMNGVETLRQIKRVSPRLLTAIMVGPSRLEGLVSDTLWSGVDGVLRKPVQIDDVLALIERQVEVANGEQRLAAESLTPSPDALRLVPEEMARKYCLLPLEVEQDQLRVAMADPANLYAIEDLRIRTSLRIQPVRVARADIESALATCYQSAAEIERQIERITPLSAEIEDETAQRLSEELVSQAPVVRAVDLMLRQAVKDQASDIHLEPQEDHLRVRFRIDGVLHDGMRLPLRVHAPIISRIKVLSNLNIAERRRPRTASSPSRWTAAQWTFVWPR
jgi:CheY-like chemotaxis protein